MGDWFERFGEWVTGRRGWASEDRLERLSEWVTG